MDGIKGAPNLTQERESSVEDQPHPCRIDSAQVHDDLRYLDYFREFMECVESIRAAPISDPRGVEEICSDDSLGAQFVTEASQGDPSPAKTGEDLSPGEREHQPHGVEITEGATLLVPCEDDMPGGLEATISEAKEVPSMGPAGTFCPADSMTCYPLLSQVADNEPVEGVRICDPRHLDQVVLPLRNDWKASVGTHLKQVGLDIPCLPKAAQTQGGFLDRIYGSVHFRLRVGMSHARRRRCEPYRHKDRAHVHPLGLMETAAWREVFPTPTFGTGWRPPEWVPISFAPESYNACPLCPRVNERLGPQ